LGKKFVFKLFKHESQIKELSQLEMATQGG